MHLIDGFGAGNDAAGDLLAAIKIPENMRNVALPGPTYGRSPDIVRPIEQRMHVKKGAGIKRELALVSSPELQMIADLECWSPNHDNQDGEADEQEIRPAPPAGPRPSKLAPRKNLCRGTPSMGYRNPRFRRPQIR
jgi:hypothetical protein